MMSPSHQGGLQAGPSRVPTPTTPLPSSSSSNTSRWPTLDSGFLFFVDPYQTASPKLEELMSSSFLTSSLSSATHFLLDPAIRFTPHVVDQLRPYGKPILSVEWAFASLAQETTLPFGRYLLQGARSLREEEEQEEQPQDLASFERSKFAKNRVVDLIRHLQSPSPSDSARGGERTVARAPKFREERLEDSPVQLPLPPIRSRTPTSDPEEKGRRLRDKGKGRGSMVSRAMQEDASLADK
ncbi:hypothetical protein BDY24DRAFT_146791 [Mrakia frigida]|uniref:uncharacterized protein n=1 Tax=Mrakia frigida TaxID=29902 RepID=UPI003FCBF20E